MFDDLQIGDKVTRMLAGTVPMDLKVTELTTDLITCGWWTFDRETGAEIDDDLDWGPPPKITGSWLLPPETYERTTDGATPATQS